MHPRTPDEDVAEQNVAAIVADRILRFGDRGSDVRAVQRALARLGYGLSGTGNYGANTQAAVADFQAKHGLELDAEVGPETAKAIDAVVSSAAASRQTAQRHASRCRSRRGRPSQPRLRRSPPRPSRRRSRGASEIGSCARAMRAISCARSKLRSTKLGYDLKGTGNYGPNTQSAVADFQARHGLEVDGEVGAETAQAIDAVLSSVSAASKSADAADSARPLAPVRPVTPPPLPSLGSPAQSKLVALLGDRSLRIGDEGNCVRTFQLALAKLGYDLKGTGTFGGATDTAVTHFQQSRGLEVDGEIGPQTAAAIDAAIAGIGGRGRARRHSAHRRWA